MIKHCYACNRRMDTEAVIAGQAALKMAYECFPEFDGWERCKPASEHMLTCAEAQGIEELLRVDENDATYIVVCFSCVQEQVKYECETSK